ncbi:MAG: alpha-amylase family glycosyl hydrolase, partial [Candidatus Korobacteraceae bacterium]
MSIWRPHPTLYEINTWVWLSDLSKQSATRVDLSSVPVAEWDAIAQLGFDAVWLMGVWERSPAGIAIANRNQNLLADFRRALPDFRPEDNVGSPYCIRRYAVDPQLGGREGLACARRELAKRGLRLILDFVPNHVAPDHPWVSEHPEYFIQGNANDARNDPSSYIVVGEKVFACGRDPYFPAWPDVLQLNAFQPGLRRAVVETLLDIAGQCDGVRCDMAMLLLNAIFFSRTWRDRAGQPPSTEYWTDVVPAVKQSHPDFLFIAEAYWDLEWELQQRGFDFCYDKRLYDRLEHDNAESVRLHLCADPAYQNKLLRFIENHDEPRAAATFSPAKERAAAVTTSTQTGARLFHEGQFEGRKVRLPVFLGRRPDEPVDRELQQFYRQLLAAI